MKTPIARLATQMRSPLANDNRFSRFLTTTALAAAGLAFIAAAPTMAHAKDVGQHDVWEFENTAPTESSLGYVRYEGDTIIDNLTQEDIGQLGHVDLRARLTVARGVEAGPMHILGKLTSTGEVYVLDVNGFLFGAGSVVDTAGFAAIAGNVADEDFLDGDGVLNIDVAEGAEIAIERGAMINVADAGLAAFVSPIIRNNGLIQAKLGKVAFASGSKVTLDLYGDELVEIAVSDELADALIENTGEVRAEGGTVIMTARAAKEAVDNVINMDGIVDVSSVEVKGGKIVLSGGDKGKVSVSGTLDARGKDGGGAIDVAGENTVVTETATLTADAVGNGNGGTIFVWGDNAAVLSGTTSANAGVNGGDGGKIELSAGKAVAFNGLASTISTLGKVGTFLIDPENINIGNYNPAATAAQLLLDAIFGNLALLTIDQQALANTLRTSNVDLWASNSISTTTDVDVSTWVQPCGMLCKLFGGSTTYGITSNDLSLSAETINISHDFTLGTGRLTLNDTVAGDSFLGFGLIDAPFDIDVETLNLNGTIFSRDSVGGPVSIAASSRIDGVAHTVNVLSDNALINQAIQFADGFMAGGAIVNVAAGTYNESVAVDRAVNLLGANAGVAGSGTRGAESLIIPNSPGFHVTSDNVTIDGFAVNGGDQGILVENADGVTLANNVLTKQDTGVSLSNSLNSRVTGNRIEGAETGIEGVNAGNLWVYNNDVVDAANFGIVVRDSDGVRYDGVAGSDVDIWRNRVSVGTGGTGILVEDSDYATVGVHVNNVFGPDGPSMGNVVNGGLHGIVVTGSEKAMVRYNTVRDVSGNGVRVTDSDDARVRDNVVSGTGSHGILATGSANTTISGNFIGFTDLGTTSAGAN
ncbi:MAG: hypothetical protein EOM26_11685, partial [Alphaproteobacteria bacterium]|nr:hypothetical protein [Alphaproteobacteria bacterium]